MFFEEEGVCVDCKPKSPAELQEYLDSAEARQVMKDFFNGPAQELMTQMQTVLTRLKAENFETLESEISK